MQLKNIAYCLSFNGIQLTACSKNKGSAQPNKNKIIMFNYNKITQNIAYLCIVVAVLKRIQIFEIIAK